MANSPLVLPPPNCHSTIDDIEVFPFTATTSGAFITCSSLELKVYVVRFAFRPPQHTARDAMTSFAHGHQIMLSLFHQLFANTITIFDNNNNKYCPSTSSSLREHSSRFIATYIPPNLHHQRGSLYLIHHRIHSTIPLSEIQRHQAVHNALKQNHLRMNRHYWSEDDVHISNIGFLVGVDPYNNLPDETAEIVRTKILSKLKCTQQMIPHFRLVRSTPYYIDTNGQRTRSRSYDIQVPNKDAKRLIVMLQQTFKNHTSFISHSLRHHDPTLYYHSICRQEVFICNSRYIPIFGISPDTMSLFKYKLLNIPGVAAVLHHKDTCTQGRWNLLTDKENFGQVHICLKQLMQRPICDPLCDDFSMVSTFQFSVSVGHNSDTGAHDNVAFSDSVLSLTDTTAPSTFQEDQETFLQEHAFKQLTLSATHTAKVTAVLSDVRPSSYNILIPSSMITSALHFLYPLFQVMLSPASAALIDVRQFLPMVYKIPPAPDYSKIYQLTSAIISKFLQILLSECPNFQ